MTAELLQIARGSKIGPDKRYEVLFELDSTNNYNYVVDFSAYIVKDHRTSRCKTLQVLDRLASAAGTYEIPEDVLKALDATALSWTLRSYDNFKHKGHLCSIHDLRGPPLSELVEGPPDSASWSKKVFRDSLLALEAIHSCGIIHGNVSDSSIVITYPSLESASPDDVTEFYKPREYDMNDFDDRNAFKHAAMSLGGEFGPRGMGRGHVLDFRVKLQNLRLAGTATNDPSKSVAYEIWPCPPPEYLIEGNLSNKVDIWSLGIVMTNIIAAAPHFITIITQREEDQVDNLNNSQRYLGPLPDKYGHTIEGLQKKSILDELKTYRKNKGFADSPEQEAERDRFSVQSLELAADLLTHMMEYDPEKRYSASQALGHKFFSTGL